MSEWARITGISYDRLWRRLDRGLSVDEAFSTDPPKEVIRLRVKDREASFTVQHLERFTANLKRDERTGCLLWAGSKSPDGYGVMAVSGENVLTHRIAFLLGGGALTKEKPFVLHGCPSGDNPSCAEFAHLRAGSHAENMVDMCRRGRSQLGRSKTGLPFGVKKARNGRWEAHVKINYRKVYLGTFDTADEAHVVAIAARDERIRATLAGQR